MGLLMVVALPLMLLGGMLLDVWTNDDGDHADDSHKDHEVVGDTPTHDEPPLI